MQTVNILGAGAPRVAGVVGIHDVLTRRKLYLIRTYDAQGRARTFGHKCRLIPFRAAMRVKRRLKRAGIDAELFPMLVNCTRAQIADMARRYDR